LGCSWFSLVLLVPVGVPAVLLSGELLPGLEAKPGIYWQALGKAAWLPDPSDTAS